MSQISTILMYEVLGRFSETAMNMVASTCRLAGKETHQHHRQVHRHNRLKEEGLEVVGHMGDDDEEDGWDVHCKDGPEESSKKQTNKSEKEWLGCTPSRLSQGCV